MGAGSLARVRQVGAPDFSGGDQVRTIAGSDQHIVAAVVSAWHCAAVAVEQRERDANAID